MDTTNKASTKFGHRSRSVTKSNFGSTSQTDKSAMLFTKDLGLNKYVMKTLASHIQVHQEDEGSANATGQLHLINENEGEQNI